MTNCKNCGGLIKDYKCQYCGTEYNTQGFQIEKSVQTKKSNILGMNTVMLGCILCGALPILFYSQFRK